MTLFMVCWSCNPKGITYLGKESNGNSNSEYLSVFRQTDGTYGYDIFQGEKRLIHQPYIPAIPGNHGFNTKRHAEQVGRMVLDKIHHGIFPPTLGVEEVNAVIGPLKPRDRKSVV